MYEALVSTGCLGWLGWLRCIQFQFKASQWKSDWAGWTHHRSINMRLDGRLVVGVFFGSAVLGSTTADQEDMCGREVNQREEEAAFQLCKLRFNCKTGEDGGQNS